MIRFISSITLLFGIAACSQPENTTKLKQEITREATTEFEDVAPKELTPIDDGALKATIVGCIEDINIDAEGAFFCLDDAALRIENDLQNSILNSERYVDYVAATTALYDAQLYTGGIQYESIDEYRAAFSCGVLKNAYSTIKRFTPDTNASWSEDIRDKHNRISEWGDTARETLANCQNSELLQLLLSTSMVISRASQFPQ